MKCPKYALMKTFRVVHSLLLAGDSVTNMRGLWLPGAGSSWHKRAGAATEQHHDLNQSEHSISTEFDEWECSTLHRNVKDNFSSEIYSTTSS